MERLNLSIEKVQIVENHEKKNLSGTAEMEK